MRSAQPRWSAASHMMDPVPVRAPEHEWEPFEHLSAEVLTGAFRFQPAVAQNAGEHAFDGQTGDFSAASIARRTAELEGHARRLEAAQPAGVELEADRRTLLTNVRTWLFQLREQREFAHNPMFYFGRNGIGDVGRYVRRQYAELEPRLLSTIQHLEAIPEAVRQVDTNLEAALAPSQLQVALDEVGRYPANYLDSLPAEILAQGGVPRVLADRFAAAQSVGAEAMRWLHGQLQARDRLPAEAFALGEAAFRRVLAYREMLDLSSAELWRVAEADLEVNQAALLEEGARMYPGQPVAEVFEHIERDHTRADEVVPFVNMVLERLRTFLIERDLVDVPSDVRIVAEPTPGHRRAGTGMTDSPGPLETRATNSLYYVTLPQVEWSTAQQEAWLRYLNRATLENLSAHEAYPGHYIHTLHRQKVTSVPRAVLRSQGFGEGWGHYAEHMMQEAGYVQADNPGLRLMQIRDALLRDCRFLAAVGMHCRGMTVAEATQLFMDRAYLPEVAARREAVRGSHDVLYLNYTLGKLQILKLREDAKKAWGSTFTLRRFHDTILDTGAPPVPIVRMLVLGAADDGKPL